MLVLLAVILARSMKHNLEETKEGNAEKQEYKDRRK
jgi:hypothetical protein